MIEPELLDIREMSNDEAERFRKNGWIKLEKFFPEWAVQGVLARAKAKMGEEPLTVSRTSPGERTPNEFGWYARWDGCSHQDEWICQLSHSRSLARVAASLIGSPVRFYFDHVFVKTSASREGSETPWHQDLPHHPLDRQGALTIWIPLVDCPPQMGTLRFLSGSHRAGLFGRYLNRRDGVSLTDENPWVLERFPISPPLQMHAGDATIHDMAIVHCAPPNTTASPRWVYVTQWLPAATRYTGAPNHRTDGLGLEVDRPLEHARFPLIGMTE